MSKKPKPWKSLPKVSVNWEFHDEFFRFVHQRHMVYYKRFVAKLPPPWTQDPILRDFKFTNVYRELDRGTIWMMENIVNPFPVHTGRSMAQRIDLFWRICLYRILNKVETFQVVGIPAYSYWQKTRIPFQRDLHKLAKEQNVFTSAHLTLPSKKNQSKIDRYIEVLDELHSELKGGDLFHRIDNAESLEEVWSTLQLIPCVGQFIAYEIAVDLTYCKLVPFSENSWVNPGPGCKFGLKLIYPNLTSRQGFIDHIYFLRDEQEKMFKKLNLDMPYYRGKLLSLRNIEHSLCEYGKYRKMKWGAGKSREYFKPKTEPVQRELFK